MWNLPRLEMEPVSLTLAGGFLTTGPPGQSFSCLFLSFHWKEAPESRDSILIMAVSLTLGA